ncbi:MAG: hypothetical protein QW407_04145 [Thermofilaceae archaeon]
MSKRELALALLVQILLITALAGYLLYWRPRAARQKVYSVQPVEEVLGLVSVDVNGTVYRGEMRSFTPYGLHLWGMLLTRRVAGGRGYLCPCGCFSGRRPSSLWMRVGHGEGYSEAVVSRWYGYNSTHMWVSFTGSFYAFSDATLKWVSLMTCVDFTPPEVAVTNDTLPSIQVPRGSVYSIMITIYWRDNGALAENFAKYFLLLSPENLDLTFKARNGEDLPFLGLEFNNPIIPCTAYLPWVAASVDHNAPNLFLIVSNRSNPPPPSRSDYDMPEVARYLVATYPVSDHFLSDYNPYVVPGRGFVIAATIQVEATEVGLVVDFIGREVLLMRWVPPQPIQPGTTVRIFLLPP